MRMGGNKGKTSTSQTAIESPRTAMGFSKHKSELLREAKPTISLRAPIPKGEYEKIHFKNIELKGQQPQKTMLTRPGNAIKVTYERVTNVINTGSAAAKASSQKPSTSTSHANKKQLAESLA